MKKMTIIGMMLAIVSVFGCAELPKKADAGIAPANANNVATTPTAKEVTVPAGSYAPGVIPSSFAYNGSPAVIEPHQTVKKHGCSVKAYYGQLQLGVYPQEAGGLVYAPDQAEIDAMLKYGATIPVDPSKPDAGWRAFCFNVNGRRALVDSTPAAAAPPARTLTPAVVDSTPAPATVTATATATATASKLSPEDIAAIAAAVNKANAPAKKAVVKKAAKKPVQDNSFYVEYIRKAGYTVAGYKKAYCIKDEKAKDKNVITKELKKFIDDAIDGISDTHCQAPAAAPAAPAPAAAPAAPAPTKK
jgi:hypothetical protein